MIYRLSFHFSEQHNVLCVLNEVTTMTYMFGNGAIVRKLRKLLITLNSAGAQTRSCP